MTEAIIALVATIFGGAGLKLVEKLFAKRDAKYAAEAEAAKFSYEDATAIRQELRAESTLLREEMKAMRDDVDHWRQQYFSLLKKYNDIELKYDTLLTEMTIIRELLKNKQDPSYIIRSLEARLGLIGSERPEGHDEENPASWG